MKKFYLILGIYFVFMVTFSLLFDSSETDRILGFEMNIWITRSIKASLAAFSFLVYFKSKKPKD